MKDEEVSATTGEASACSQMVVHLKITWFLFGDFGHQQTKLFIFLRLKGAKTNVRVAG